MSAILAELDQVLRSKNHKLTKQETDLLQNCKSKAIKDYGLGAIFGGVASVIATSKLNLLGCLTISAGVSALVGLWRFENSLESCVDHILALEGSRMQRELANIIGREYWNHPWKMRYITKYFYAEEVFGDSSSDKPELRWRYRNVFTDFDYGQSTYESNLRGDSQMDSRSNSHGERKDKTQSESRSIHKDARVESEGRKLNSESKKAPMNSAADAMDPLDCIFGFPAMEEIHRTNPSTASPRVLTRKERRAHRRRRMHHHENVLLKSPQHA